VVKKGCMLRRFFAVREVLCLLGIAVLFARGPARAEDALQVVLPNLQGGIFSLEEELKKGPKMQEVADAYREHGVGVFTINVDGPRNQAKIRPFIKRHKLRLPVLLDKTNEVAKQFHLVAIPSTLVIAQNGKVVYRHQGYRPGDEEKLKEALDELLGIKKTRESEAEGVDDA
jgi:thiol-disulfide isomerase/thioredoxin